MSKIKISIPQPCHENWEGMTTVDKGKFCNSCQKNVYDFTSLSDREIINAFDKNKNLCGRFLNSQLNRDLVKPKEKNSLWLATTTALISLIGLSEVKAQEKVKTEQTDKKVFSDSIKIENEEIEVTGVVYDKNRLIPIPGVDIIIKGKSIHTQTDNNGLFKIKGEIGDTLLVIFIGYEDKKLVIKNSEIMSIIIEYAPALEGDVYVGFAKSRTFFGRIFHAIGNWFK